MVNAPLTCRLDDKLIVEGNACVMVNVEIQFSTGYLFSLSSSFFFFPPPLYPLDLARIERTSNLCPRNCIFLPSPLSFYTGNNTDNRSIVFEAIILLTEIYHHHRHRRRHPMPHESVNWLLVRSTDIVDVFAIYSIRIVDSSRFSRDVFLLKSGITCHVGFARATTVA